MTTTTNGSIVSQYIKDYNLPTQLATGILRTQQDCEDFIHNHRTNGRVANDLLDYRERTINKRNTNVDEFVFMCYDSGCGMKEAFEYTFLQSFTDLDIDMIQDMVKNGDLNLVSLYNTFNENINQNIFRIIL